MLIDIDKIKVTERARKAFSNIDKLAESIKENGLIHPPTVTPDLNLIAGERRLRACKQLGYQQIEVRVMTVTDNAHHLKLERDENDNREAFTFSEAVELGRRIEEIEREKAKERMESGGVENFPQGAEGKTRDIVAAQVGFGSGKQYEKAKFIVDNADEEMIRQLDEKLISVHAAYQKLKKDSDADRDRADRAEEENQKLKKKLENVITEDQKDEFKSAIIEEYQTEIAPQFAERETKIKQLEAKYNKAIEIHSGQVEKYNVRIEELSKSKAALSPEAKKEMEQLKEQVKKYKEEADKNGQALKNYMDSYVDEQREFKASISKIRHEIGSITLNVSTRVKSVKMLLNDELQFHSDVQKILQNAIEILDEVKIEISDLLGGQNGFDAKGRVYVDAEIVGN